MLRLIIGKKGTGKTKKMVEKANIAARTSDGAVIFIEKGEISTYRLSHKIRLADALSYKIETYDELYGFVLGMVASNYDIKEIYVDAVTRLCGKDIDELLKFMGKLGRFSDDKNIKVVLSVSCERSELPPALPAHLFRE